MKRLPVLAILSVFTLTSLVEAQVPVDNQALVFPALLAGKQTPTAQGYAEYIQLVLLRCG